MDDGMGLVLIIGTWFLVSLLVSPMIGLMLHGRREGRHASPLDAPRIRYDEE